MFDRCLYFNTNVLARKVDKLWAQAYGELGLAPAHAYLLRLVLEKPGLVQRDIAQELSLEKSTITRFIDKMVEEGYLYRTTSQGSLREQAIYPTDKAIVLKDKLNETGNQLYKKMQQLLNEDELKSMVGKIRTAGQKL